MPSAVLLASLSLLPSEDFLVGRPSTPTTLTKDATGALLLSNGLISRRFVTSPNFVTSNMHAHFRHHIAHSLGTYSLPFSATTTPNQIL